MIFFTTILPRRRPFIGRTISLQPQVLGSVPPGRGGEANVAVFRRRWVHELANSGEDRGDGLVMVGRLLIEPRFELIEAAGQLLVRGEKFAQLHEGAHDMNAHGDGARGVRAIGGLGGAVLGKGERPISPAAPT